MSIYTTSQARQQLFQLVDSINQTHQPIYIVGKRNKAVLVAQEDYQAMIETLHIVSVPGLKESILQMRDQPLNTYTDKIDL